MPYLLLADAVLVLHAAVVLFVLGGLVLLPLGNRRGWHWVNGWWFRLVHLAAIATVVAQAWAGVVCPLTTFEMWLRLRGGDAVYGGGFVAHWVGRLLYHEAPAWVFTLGYTVFAAAVLLAWWRYPPSSCVDRETV